MANIRFFDWLTLFAVFLGPILAVQAQKFVEERRERRRRRLQLFHSLMATRADRLGVEHVRALNMIDIEFYGRLIRGVHLPTSSEKAVRNAWRNYSDSLDRPPNQTNPGVRYEERDNCFYKLLYELSRALGYDFDEVSLRRNVYSPVAHGEAQRQDHQIREGFAAVLTGERSILVQLQTPSEHEPETGA